MKYYSGQCSYKYSWDQVATAFWHRYPNPYSNHVLTEDTVSRRVSNSKLYSIRLITKTSKMPKWGERFISGPKNVCVVEESIVDPKAKTLTTYTRNIGFTKVMTVDEKCVYRQNPENKDWTVCDRQAWIGSSVFGFAYALQTFGYERFKQHSGKSVKGFEYILHKMFVPEIIPDQQPAVNALTVNKEKLKTTAKKAKELAKAKAVPVVAHCTGSNTAS